MLLVAEKDQTDRTCRRFLGVDGIMMISRTGDSGGGVSGRLVCIVVFDAIGLTLRPA